MVAIKQNEKQAKNFNIKKKFRNREKYNNLNYIPKKHFFI